MDTRFEVTKLGAKEDKNSFTFSMIVLDKKGQESKKGNFGLPDMSGYCEKKRETSSHHFDVTLAAELNAIKSMNTSFRARENQAATAQFYVYICDCFGDFKNFKPGLKVQTSIQVLSQESS